MELPKRSLKGHALLVSKGLAMGAADVVPGVSGGTIALISGIYDELLYSLKQISPQALLVLRREGPAAFWQHINGTFLLCVFAGILLSLKTFAALITFALAAYPIVVWSFFFGLIVASVIFMGKQQSGWRLLDWFGLIVGTLLVYGVTLATPTQLPSSPLIFFGGGFIAICAMILPGISGSFLLLLMGLYPAFIAAINNLEWVALASFGAGCVSGLLLFSRFLSWLLNRFHKITMAVLIGFLVGSLNAVWPWKVTLESVVDRHGETVPVLQQSVSPWQFEAVLGVDSMLIPALTAFATGMFLLLFTEYLGGLFRFKNEGVN